MLWEIEKPHITVIVGEVERRMKELGKEEWRRLTWPRLGEPFSPKEQVEILGFRVIGGTLDYFSNKRVIDFLPENLWVEGDLILWRNEVVSLPKGLKVCGNLDLRETGVETLPEGLEVGKNLLCGSVLKALPKGLKVGGCLELYEGVEIPEDATVGSVYRFKRWWEELKRVEND